MGPFSAPLAGRFTAADARRSRIASHAVLGGPAPADMVYINGYLDHPYTVNPVRIRAYDHAGNPLAAVRLNGLRDHDYTGVVDAETWRKSRDHGYVVTGTDRDGASITVFGDAVIDVMIQDMVVDDHGHIYCAMAPGHRAAYRPKSGYTLDYVLSELAGLSGTAWSTRRNQLADSVSPYFNGYFRKYRRNGDRISFPELHGGLIISLALDSAGNIYAGGVPVGGPQNMLRKYDSSGTLLWSAGTSEPATGTQLPGVYQIVLDASGNAYVVGIEGAKSFFKKYDSDGTLQWTRRLPGGVLFRTVAIDDEGYLYTGAYYDGYTINDEYTVHYFNEAHTETCIQKWDSDGNYIISALFQTVRYYSDGSVVTNDAELYLIQYVNRELHCKASWGLQKDPYIVCGKDLQRHTSLLPWLTYVPLLGLSYSGYYDYLAVDSSGRQYLPRMVQNRQFLINGVSIGEPNAHLAVWDVNPIKADKLWRDRNALGDTEYPYSNPLSEYILPDTSGSGHAGWSVGMGGWFVPYLTSSDPLASYRWYCLTGRSIFLLESSAFPALDLPVSLTAPSWLGDLYSTIPALAIALGFGVPALFRDYVGRPRQTIYRLFLTGSPNIELPLASFQVRRNTNQDWLECVVPIPDSATVAAINARTDGDLVVMRGVRLDDGEMMDEMIRVSFGGMRTDTGAKSSSATLSGSATVAATPKTRALRGISYRAFDDGLRRIRCEVDTYLAPGDTADCGGGETLLVETMNYQVSPQSATMEISEARS